MIINAKEKIKQVKGVGVSWGRVCVVGGGWWLVGWWLPILNFQSLVLL